MIGSKKYLVISLLLFCKVVVAQDNSVVMSNYLKAEKIIEKSISNCGGISKLKKPLSFSLVGTKYFFGHFDVPEKTIPAVDSERISFFPENEISYLRSEINYYGFRKKNILNGNDSTMYFGYFSKDYTKGKLAERNQVYLTSPIAMLNLAERFKSSLHFVGEDSKHNVVSFNDDLGNSYNLYFDKKLDRLDKITQLTYTNMYGDSFDEVIYEYNNAESVLPVKFIKKEHGLLESSFTYKNFDETAKIDSQFVSSICPNCKLNKDESKNSVEFEKIDESLWLISLTNLNNKMLLAEYETYLTVFEAPKDVETCSEVIRQIKIKFPNKPIKKVVLSHHHPDHAGGFATFVQNNSTIVTTKGNVGFFTKLLSASQTLKPANFIEPSKINFELINENDSLKISDKLNACIVYENGVNTDHTKEHLFNYFPKQKILFVGDLISFPENGVNAQGKRAYSIFKLIKDKNLTVDKIYTAWPLKNQKKFGTLQDLIQSLKKNYPDISEN